MAHEFDDLQHYILEYWDTLKIENTVETKTSLGLPFPYYVPSMEIIDGFRFANMYYWDTYFIAQGLWRTEREGEILGLVENMFDLMRRFGLVPNANSFALLSRSQPPFLSSLTRQFYERQKKGDIDWLGRAYDCIQEEYENVWMGNLHPHNRNVFKGLSRYYDANVLDILAEAESGWDYTTRFEDHCLQFLPIDLNALLYKCELDMALFAEEFENEKLAHSWKDKAEQRRQVMTELMWDEESGLFYDYNYRQGRKGNVQSLATYVPLFAGLASEEQARRLVENLSLFETEFGLSTTNKNDDPAFGKQWANPNGWAPLHDMVVDGLLRYGYEDRAKEIAYKWVKTVQASFQKNGIIYEKYNMLHLNGDVEKAVYPDQTGFGWTNGVTYKFINFLKS